VLKLERIPLELLVLLLEHRDEIVRRDEIVSRVWGKGVFLDTDNSIRSAIRKLRQVLKDDAETPRFIQTITGQGYRFIAPVSTDSKEENRADVSPHPAEKEPTAETPLLHPRVDGRPRVLAAGRWLVLSGVAVLALIATAYIAMRRHAADATAPRIKSLAVLPLKNLSGDPAQEYLADGMTEELIGKLANIHDLRVISRTSVMHYKQTQLSVPEIAKTLQVDALVEGSVIREGGRIRVHAQLIRGTTDEHFWSETYDRELGEVLALESDVAQSIARKVEVTVTGQEQSRLIAARQVSPDVYENYLKGNFANRNTRAGMERSISYFEEAIKRDPTFAPAYVGLANAYMDLGSVFGAVSPDEIRPKMISAARKALELDPELAEAHVLLADTYLKQWKWEEAKAEFNKALELNPNDAAAHLGFADWFLFHGRTEEAVAWSRRARELDPLGGLVTHGWILFQSRHYDESIQEFRSVIAVNPDDAIAHWFLGYALIATGQPEQAIPVLEKAVSLSNRSPAVLGVLVRAYAHAGRRDDALRVLTELKKRKQVEYVPAAAFVNSYLGLGDNEQAFVWLEKAYAEQSGILQLLKVHPHFDPLRSDPRFANLLHRVGLDKAN
jgi:TolB-like protein/DNA-binding winged helix-turn-helix (wHTH) protein/Tfp pilus assembly protein PilF